MTAPDLTNRRRLLLAALASAVVPSGAQEPISLPPADPIRGTVEALTLASRRTGITYPLRLYTPPGATRAAAPIVYLLDAEWRLDALARAIEACGLPVRIAGIANEATRDHDDVPQNACIAGGGGQAAFFDFIRFELVPFVEARVAVDPSSRALMGHSFGGALVLYALFHEPADQRLFQAYLAADPAIRCIGGSATEWDADYAATHDRLPAALHFSYANPVAAPYAARLAQRGYRGLRMASKAYAGGHDGMIPAAFADAIAFAFAPPGQGHSCSKKS